MVGSEAAFFRGKGIKQGLVTKLVAAGQRHSRLVTGVVCVSTHAQLRRCETGSPTAPGCARASFVLYTLFPDAPVAEADHRAATPELDDLDYLGWARALSPEDNNDVRRRFNVAKNMPKEQKSRQSSGGRSFFSKLTKDKNDSDSPPSIPSSNNGSQSSRHTKDTSFSDERPISYYEPGLSLQAGVITAYTLREHIEEQSRTESRRLPPSRRQQNTYKSGSATASLNKSGVDFHQYPVFDTSMLPPASPARAQSNGPRGPRALNGQSTASRASERAPPASIYSGRSGVGGYPASSNGQTLHGDRSDTGRAASDVASLYSNTSPNRASSIALPP
ncbi:hypothetical protein MRB53_038716 [Persea americana]|nr:hypothetical protein MRB53_038716 [Persea americana]